LLAQPIDRRPFDRKRSVTSPTVVHDLRPRHITPGDRRSFANAQIGKSASKAEASNNSCVFADWRVGSMRRYMGASGAKTEKSSIESQRIIWGQTNLAK
jgi:hypothetical protein